MKSERSWDCRSERIGLGREDNMATLTPWKIERRKKSNVEGWSVVLASRTILGDMEFVTWNYNDESDEKQSGHYFQSLTSAIEDYDQRR